jgi:hypothetical protein
LPVSLSARLLLSHRHRIDQQKPFKQNSTMQVLVVTANVFDAVVHQQVQAVHRQLRVIKSLDIPISTIQLRVAMLTRERQADHMAQVVVHSAVLLVDKDVKDAIEKRLFDYLINLKDKCDKCDIVFQLQNLIHLNEYICSVQLVNV